ncbi:PA domain-containing protein [Luteimonas aquatica]|uniref:PA domain-containing protein n=1 Tax=Luteimonas aquatica TaxID=450364 RepID=UPI001F57EF46|nr:PA domain-containing protein [Luteimonas aquatica]
MKRHLLATFVAAALCGSAAQAAVITPVNLDPANQGLNDPTPRAPEGSNPGTTVGEQRRIAYQFAADLWGSTLRSDVEIRVGASFQPLACTATGGTLGSAGPWWIWQSPDFPVAGAWYHIALADAIAGSNLMLGDPAYTAPDDIEINSRFNANLGSPGCLENSGWYYGLDGNTPAGRISFLDVVMHEIGHGLGFSGFVGYTSGVLGERVGTPGVNDVYTHNAFDNFKALRFDDAAMSNADRAAALRTPGRTVWDGAKVTGNVPLVLDQLVLLRASGALTADYGYGTASFGPAATPANFSGALALANDGAGPDSADACDPLPTGSLSGKIAFINRGGPPAPAPACGFEKKAVNAESAGAIAVIIGNVATSSTPGTPPGMADDPTLTANVPTLSLNLADANAVRAALAGGAVNVALGPVPGRLAGADVAGRAQLYTPTTVAGGSTFSHFDTALTPNALMEPAINDSLASNVMVDLTLDLFADEGWSVNTGNARIGRCETALPLSQDGGLISGANIRAHDRLCRATSANHGQYVNCMKTQADALQSLGLINAYQRASVVKCAAQNSKPGN